MLISVVIPSYNHEKYILEAINSVLNQTYKNLELIIIDDGSKDSSIEILKKISDARVQVIVQENQGAHAAINRGLSLCIGDYITILNSDDVFDLQRFEELVKWININQVDFLCTWIDVIDANGKTTGTKKGWDNMLPTWASSNRENGFWLTDDFVLNAISTNFVSTTSNMFFRREVYDEIGGMKNLRFAHDWDFLLRVCTEFKADIIPKALMKYRIHGTNTIKTNDKWMMFEVMWVLANNLDNFTDRLFLGAETEEELSKKIQSVFSSINFKGNDRVFWVLREFIRNNNNDNYDFAELLLCSTNLRQIFIDLIE